MAADNTQVRDLLRRGLAHRLLEPDINWLEETLPLTAQGIGSLDLIAVLARIQRDAGLSLPEDFAIDADTSLLSVAVALKGLAPPSATDRDDR
jgi:hypothetical protein